MAAKRPVLMAKNLIRRIINFEVSMKNISLPSKKTFTVVLTLLVICFLAGAVVPAQAQTVTTLYDFVTNSSVTQQPSGVIAQGRDGNFYGITQSPDRGTIYKVTPSGTFTLLHTMASDLSEGANCNGLILGSDGNFYGTCLYGGANSIGNGLGTIIKVTPAGVLTVLHSFTGQNARGSTDGCYPRGVPVQASDGNFYGTGQQCGTSGGDGIAYKLTPAGVYTVIYNFTGSTNDGAQPFGALIQGSDGNLWGITTSGPTVFKLSTAGVIKAVYSFTCCGTPAQAGLVQGPDGNYYGTTEGIGANNQGEVFKVTPAGVFTVLHSFNNAVDHGGFPVLPLSLGTDGNFYGVATDCGAGGCSPLGANIFEITSKGAFTDLYNFPNPGSNNDSVPESPLFLSTNGKFYGTTQLGGTSGDGTFYSLTNGQTAFIQLQETTGRVGSKIGILGQGFSASSVVKFNGVTATTVTRTGTTFLLATVPAGANDGFVTVTTGAVTLTSSKKFVVHNSWSSGKAMPTAVFAAASGFIGGKIYVVSGNAAQGGPPVSNNQVYNPTSNSWTTAAAIPTPVFAPASAVVGGLLYVIGGYEGTGQTPTNLVQIYTPATNKWTTGAAMPTARGSIAAVVDGTAIYVIGGNGSTNRLNNVEKYVPSTNTWTTEAPLLVGKSEPSAGLLGTTIVAADGFTTSADTGDNEGYSVSTNIWTARTADPTPRNASCYGSLLGQLYVAGGMNKTPQSVTLNESFSATTNKWTTQLPIPTASLWQASAVASGQLYCIGGQNNFQGTAITNVQIYQP
jgi:uncharacterized repeat protein (TIGR03803 family)